MVDLQDLLGDGCLVPLVLLVHLVHQMHLDVDRCLGDDGCLRELENHLACLMVKDALEAEMRHIYDRLQN